MRSGKVSLKAHEVIKEDVETNVEWVSNEGGDIFR